MVRSYSVLPYGKFLKEVKNKGYKPHLHGLKSVAQAEAAANALVGTCLTDSLPLAKEAIRVASNELPTTGAHGGRGVADADTQPFA